jgi:hypothetical protein
MKADIGSHAHFQIYDVQAADLVSHYSSSISGEWIAVPPVHNAGRVARSRLEELEFAASAPCVIAYGLPVTVSPGARVGVPVSTVAAVSLSWNPLTV